MIRVLHIITDLGRGGAELMLVKLLATLDRTRFSNNVVSLMDGPLAPDLAAMGIPLRSLGMNKKFNPRPLWRLRRIIHAEEPDIIQSWLYHADLFGLIAAQRTDRLIWNIRNSVLDLSPSTRFVVRLLAKFSGMPAAIVVNSRAGRLHHQTLNYHPRQWIEIPNGFDLARWRPDASAGARLRAEMNFPADALLVGMFARRDPMKDHPTFLAALAEARAKEPRIHAILAGRGTESFSNLLDRHGLAGKVALLGERDDLPALAPALDVFCLASLGEGFPNVIGEAMACGVPCVASDVGDIAEIIGDTGRVVPARNPHRLAAALLEVLTTSPQERGLAARRRIEERYSLASVAHRYEEVYEAVAAGKPPK
jgi:glycosyltransferase involved in cell wall biosynthesis